LGFREALQEKKVDLLAKADSSNREDKVFSIRFISRVAETQGTDVVL